MTSTLGLGGGGLLDPEQPDPTSPSARMSPSAHRQNVTVCLVGGWRAGSTMIREPMNIGVTNFTGDCAIDVLAVNH